MKKLFLRDGKLWVGEFPEKGMKLYRLILYTCPAIILMELAILYMGACALPMYGYSLLTCVIIIVNMAMYSVWRMLKKANV